MKISNILATITALTAPVLSEVTFEDWTATEVTVGESYTIQWVTDSDALERIIQLGLIRLSDDPAVYWEVIENLAFEIITAKPGGSIEWTVNESLELGSGYGLFLVSEPKRQYPWWRDRHQSEDQTIWFNITAPKDESEYQEELKLKL